MNFKQIFFLGILSLFLANVGAKKVYAVEGSSLAELIPTIAKDNGFSDIIHVFHCSVEDVEIPENEKIEAIVSEWMGFYLVHECMLESVIFARDKFLTEDGILFPSEAKLFACPCSLENLYNEQINFWNNVCGFNLSAMGKFALKSKSIKPDVTVIQPKDLLAQPECIQHFNLRYISKDEIRHFSSRSFVSISKSGVFQGVVLWFDCLFDGRDYDENGEEFGALITLSTSPFNLLTHWKQTVIVFGGLQENSSKTEENNKDETNSDNYLEENEVIGWKLDFKQSDANDRKYLIELEMLDPETNEHPIPCQCSMPKCLIIAKLIENDNFSENLPD